jgi:hypothetical protein
MVSKCNIIRAGESPANNFMTDDKLMRASVLLACARAKSKSGTPLSSEEEKILKAVNVNKRPFMPGGVKSYAKTKTELAELVGCSRATIHRASHIKGFPSMTTSGWHVPTVKEFIIDRIDIKDEDSLDTTPGELRAEQKRKLKILNDEAEGKLVSKDDLVRDASKTLSEFKDLVYQKLGNEIPIALAGVDVAQARIIGSRFADELLSELKKSFNSWSV